MALQLLAGSDSGEKCPVGFAGVEERADAVVGEAGEPMDTRLTRFMRLLMGAVRSLL